MHKRHNVHKKSRNDEIDHGMRALCAIRQTASTCMDIFATSISRRVSKSPHRIKIGLAVERQRARRCENSGRPAKFACRAFGCRSDTPGSAGVPPALSLRLPLLRCCSRPPCRREPHGPGRSRGRAPLPVDSGGGDGRSCGRICAGGTPALPGGLPPMTGSHQRDKSAEAFWRQLSLKEVHQSWCLFVFIRGSS